ncbi:membrane protein insertion efficiency factor YidD [bacterium]|nr:membrane protein insertion efficiency factor YidD [bacterium]
MNLQMKICTTILLLLLAQSSAWAQSDSLPDLHNLFVGKQIKTTEKWGVRQADNEFQLLFSGLFVGYKSFLSSQDNARCNFYPSCSVFAIHAIQQKGVFIGVLSAFDRLSRCNGFNTADYNRRKDNYLLDDPVF